MSLQASLYYQFPVLSFLKHIADTPALALLK